MYFLFAFSSISLPHSAQDTELTLRRGAAIGLTVSTTVALALTAIFTCHWILSILVTANLIASMAVVVAMLTCLGPIDLIGTIDFCILAGTSLDYSLHIAIAFSHSKAPTRTQRVYDAVLEVGPSVAGAAVTTIGSSAFLFGGILVPFRSIGLFFLLNALAGCGFAMTFLVALLAGFGPEPAILSPRSSPSSQGLELTAVMGRRQRSGGYREVFSEDDVETTLATLGGRVVEEVAPDLTPADERGPGLKAHQSEAMEEAREDDDGTALLT